VIELPTIHDLPIRRQARSPKKACDTVPQLPMPRSPDRLTDTGRRENRSRRKNGLDPAKRINPTFD
jgi:hypothetical protein